MDPSTVYFVIQHVPEGKVTSYGHIAFLANYPNNARQVGQYLKYLPRDSNAEYNIHNVPWQRVINSQGVVPKRPGFDNHVEVLGKEVEVDDNGRVDLNEFGWFPEEVEGL